MPTAGFKDHFSGHAADYARHRPGYPPALFEWLAAQCGETGLVWDAGTGNGQVALGLVPHFTRVMATDASAEQVERAASHPCIDFRVEPAERSSLADTSVDLATVGQALHWFDFEPFFKEVHRVLKPGGLFAAWTYLLNRVSPGVDAVIEYFYGEVIHSWWPPERRHVEQAYADLPFPFAEIEVPEFDMQTHMTLPQFKQYVGTWSAVRRFVLEREHDPLALVAVELETAWGDPQSGRAVYWPLAVRAGFTPVLN